MGRRKKLGEGREEWPEGSEYELWIDVRAEPVKSEVLGASYGGLLFGRRYCSFRRAALPRISSRNCDVGDGANYEDLLQVGSASD